MRYFIFTLFLSNIFFLNAQNCSILEEKKGFKDFIIGNNISKYINQLEFIEKKNNGHLQYRYKGTCCNTILNYSIERTDLYFNNNILEAIKITLPFIGNGLEGSQNARKILQDWTNYFGEIYKLDLETSGESQFWAWWISNNYVMKLDMYYYSIEKGFSPIIWIMKKKEIKNDF